MTENPLNGTEQPTNKAKVKGPINTPSLLGFLFSLGYNLSSVMFWTLLFIDDVTEWRDAWGYAVTMFILAAVMLGTGLVLSAVGIGLAIKYRTKRSLFYAIAGIGITCITFAVNFAVLEARISKNANREPSWTPNTTYTEPAIWTKPEETFIDEDEYEEEAITTEKRTMIFGTGAEKIDLWSFTDEIPKMVGQYIKQNPDFGEKYTVECTIIATDGGCYQTALDNALISGGENAPDIYSAERAFVYKYVQGDMAKYAATYEELGIDVDTKIKEADIAKYSVEIGSRDGKVVALGFQATGCAMIYNAEIAKDVFGTDDPEKIEKIVGAGTGKWDKFLEAAEKLKDKGYAAVSGPDDVWNACNNSAKTPWVVDGKLNVDSNREKYLDLAKTIKDKGYSNNGNIWSESWYQDMKGEGEKKVFAFFGPAWLINYVMVGNSGLYSEDGGTYGKWRVCAPPVGFHWGGTWIFAGKDTDQKAGVAELIEWITLDPSDTGLQYLWANGLVDWDNDPETKTAKDTVASAVVMDKSDGSLDFCGWQNIFPAFIKGNNLATGKGVSQYDGIIRYYYEDAAQKYVAGEIDKIEVMEQFKQQVKENIAF